MEPTPGMLIADARRRAGLSQRELAQRAGTSAAAICLYENGDREPLVGTLRRILQAAGAALVIGTRIEPIDVHENARLMQDALDLADHLPSQHADKLPYPVFKDLAP